MLVQIHWTNKSYDYVKDFMLESLIEAGVITRFLRSSGWVTIGIDPVRANTPNRGKKGHKPNCLSCIVGVVSAGCR